MFIYIIHFDTRLSHAEHYVGSTNTLEARLKAHAKGYGARITKELKTQRTNWRLSTLYHARNQTHREIEARIKKQKNTPAFCKICTEQPRVPKGCDSYDLKILEKEGWPTEAKHFIEDKTPQAIKIDVASSSDFNYIIATMKTEKATLGFIPSTGVQEAITRGRILIARTERMERLGFLLITESDDRCRIKIQQCVVNDADRNMGVGKALVEMQRWRTPYASTQCKVRSDLAENHFWKSIGFEKVREVKHKTSGSTLNQYYAPPQLAMLPKDRVQIKEK